MPVTAEEVARAWLRVERSREAGVSADRIRTRRETARRLTRAWGTEQRKQGKSNDFTQSQVGDAPTDCNVNSERTPHKAA